MNALTKDRSTSNSKYKFSFIGNGSNSVVPVLQRWKSGKYRLIGTGFMVASPNVFVTAKHIFKGNDINVGDDRFYIVDEEAECPAPISDVLLHDDRDGAIFTVNFSAIGLSPDLTPVAIKCLPPDTDEIIGSFVYANSFVDPSIGIFENKDSSVDQYCKNRSHWEVGGVKEVFGGGRGFVKGQCFSSSLLIESRASGGPVFNSKGFVIGINSRAFKFDGGLPDSTILYIEEIAKLEVNGTCLDQLWNTINTNVVCTKTT